VQLPTGEVLTIRLVKSSGNSAYDAAVERAILKSSPLPLPPSRDLFSRELKLTFRPHDK
jgi:colicin import membrane protein